MGELTTLEHIVADFEEKLSGIACILKGEELEAEVLEILEQFKDGGQLTSPLYDRFSKLRGKLNDRLIGMYKAAEDLKKESNTQRRYYE